MLARMPHEDYVPAPVSPDHSFDPSSLYQSLPRPAADRIPGPPPTLSPRLAKTAVAFALAGVVFLLVGGRRIARSEATRGWIETSARIASAKIRATGDGEYHVDLDYRYRAGPRELRSTRIAFEPALSRDAAYAYAERFRPGARVPAWFDPAAPGSAVLEHPDVPFAWGPGAFGALLIAIGLLPFGRQLFRLLRHRVAVRRAATL